MQLELVHAIHAQNLFVMEKREQTGIICKQGAASTKPVDNFTIAHIH